MKSCIWVTTHNSTVAEGLFCGINVLFAIRIYVAVRNVLHKHDPTVLNISSLELVFWHRYGQDNNTSFVVFKRDDIL